MNDNNNNKKRERDDEEEPAISKEEVPAISNEELLKTQLGKRGIAPNEHNNRDQHPNYDQYTDDVIITVSIPDDGSVKAMDALEQVPYKVEGSVMRHSRVFLDLVTPDNQFAAPPGVTTEGIEMAIAFMRHLEKRKFPYCRAVEDDLVGYQHGNTLLDGEENSGSLDRDFVQGMFFADRPVEEQNRRLKLFHEVCTNKLDIWMAYRLMLEYTIQEALRVIVSSDDVDKSIETIKAFGKQICDDFDDIKVNVGEVDFELDKPIKTE